MQNPPDISHHTADAIPGHHPVSRYSSQDARVLPVDAASICDVGFQMQKPLLHRASDNFSKIFQSSNLELTDADLEFDLK